MDAFLTSTLAVALAEIGDKTQLLAIVLAARFARPWPIIAGIFVATIANHAIAAFLGATAAGFFEGEWFAYAVAIGFIVMGLWTLIPDTLEDDEQKPSRFGPFVATTIAFFLVEMGDKTQLATIALGAQFQSVGLVAAGTTLGMMIANVPAVFAGQAILRVVPLKLIRWIAAALFIALGLFLLGQVTGLL